MKRSGSPPRSRSSSPRMEAETELGRAVDSASIEVREMTAGDYEAVARLATQLGYPSSPEQIERRFAALHEAPDARVWVATDAGGSVLGWIHLFGNRHLESDKSAEIGGLVVDESTRGRGIGRRLVLAAESWARARGYSVIAVRSNVIRTEAHGFYTGLGYETQKSQFKFRKML